MTFDVSNACAGMLTGVTILNNWIRQGIVENGLVVSGEYISQLGLNAAHHIRTIVGEKLACLTLGDAGAALCSDVPMRARARSASPASTTIADTAGCAWPIRRAGTRRRTVHRLQGDSADRDFGYAAAVREVSRRRASPIPTTSTT